MSLQNTRKEFVAQLFVLQIQNLVLNDKVVHLVNMKGNMQERFDLAADMAVHIECLRGNCFRTELIQLR